MKRIGWKSAAAVAILSAMVTGVAHGATLQAGAAAVDVTPETLPVLVNGGMTSRSLDKVNVPLKARALALSDGHDTVVLMVVDSCMMPRPLLDDVKRVVSERTGVPTQHLLISATHSHTAPSCMGALGTNADPTYIPFFKRRLVDAMVMAVKHLRPARIGFASTDAASFTALRRWIRRPDRIANDPFGNPTVRANMHAARNRDDVTGESGPEDPALSLIAVQSLDGEPIAVLANFSMHYYGDRNLSADYYGRFCRRLEEAIGRGTGFVGIMSHGCSGDIWRRDYMLPKESWDPYPTIDDYSAALAELALAAYRNIKYEADADVEMAERRFTLKYRVPDQQRLEWARRIVKAMGDRLPKTREEIYAREQIFLHERQQTTVVVQAVRIGSIAIASTPTETYAVTGLKIKAASPLEHTIVIELANGGDGYIPPPEQHRFGGYNTWPARSAGLEVAAEPRITEACIELLEEVTGKPRRRPVATRGPAARAIAALRPAAWWRLDEMHGPRAVDSSGHGTDAFYEPDVTFFLEGPRSALFCDKGKTNRAAMFVGGRLQARIPRLGDHYAVSLWLWNGMPLGARPIAGWLFSRGDDYGLPSDSEHLGVAGKGDHAGKLVFMRGSRAESMSVGKTVIPRWTWQQVVFVRDGARVRVYLNGKLEIDVDAPARFPPRFDQLFVGGRCDRSDGWEGRLDEVAVFDRALNEHEIGQLAGPRP